MLAPEGRGNRGEHSIGSERSGWAEGSPLLVLCMGGETRVGPRRAPKWVSLPHPTQHWEVEGQQQKLENVALTEGTQWDCSHPRLGSKERCQPKPGSKTGPLARLGPPLIPSYGGLGVTMLVL